VVAHAGTRIDYLIDGQNRRVGKKRNGTLEKIWLYQNGLNVVAEFNGSGTLISRFVYGSRSNVPDYMVTADGTYRIISDQLGSVRRVVNASTGELKQRLEYDAWGQVLMDTSPGFQPFGYAGGLYDLDTKLVRFGARDYDASVGRWTAKDALVDALAAGSLYGYCKDDPVNRLDPWGLHWEYSQKSGDLTYVDDKTGQRTWVGKGYSGHGEGLNNPSKVDVRDVGPIPQGWWTIGPPFAGAQGSPEFHLTPNSDTVIPPGRNPTSFYIHADNAAQNFTASKGCPVLGRTPDIRLRIKRSHDRRLEVVP
jgi:RHS repeat-associated protein